jgi:hypothetical protein
MRKLTGTRGTTFCTESGKCSVWIRCWSSRRPAAPQPLWHTNASALAHMCLYFSFPTCACILYTVCVLSSSQTEELPTSASGSPLRQRATGSRLSQSRSTELNVGRSEQPATRVVMFPARSQGPCHLPRLFSIKERLSVLLCCALSENRSFSEELCLLGCYAV